jgi:hypothetical protein
MPVQWSASHPIEPSAEEEKLKSYEVDRNVARRVDYTAETNSEFY